MTSNTNKTFIIAEGGINHNGKLELAKKMIVESKEAGADAIKFQTFKSEDLSLDVAETAPYQSEKKKSQLKLLKKYELTQNQQLDLYKFSKKHKIEYMSSAFDLDSLIFLRKLGVKKFKIPSGELTNYFLLKEYSRRNDKVILSTGMSDLYEIKRAIKILLSGNLLKKNLILMHCNTSYPTPERDVNLNSIAYLKCATKHQVGFSDHTENLETPALAVVAGANIIEKHVTLNKKLAGPDHKASLNFYEFKKMVTLIRSTEKMLGVFDKKKTKSEKKNIFFSRKSIVARTNIKIGEKFSSKNLN